MNTAALSKTFRVTFRTILLLQITHSLLVLFIYRRPLGYAWPERLFWVSLTAFAIGIEIMVLVALLRRRQWAWNMTLILLIDACLYMVWNWDLETPVVRGIFAVELLVVAFCFVLLLNARIMFGVAMSDWAKIGASFALASIVVFLTGAYFRHLNLQWAYTVPRWYEIVVDSGFLSPEENLLSLSWVCSIAIASAARCGILPLSAPGLRSN